MSTAARMNAFGDAFNQFLGTKPLEFFASAMYADADNVPTVDETRKTLEFVLSTITSLLASKHRAAVPVATVNNMHSGLNEAFNSYQQLLSTRDQGSFQQFALRLDSFAQTIRTFGIPYLVAGGSELESIRAQVASELARMTANNADVETLKREVQTLITPAVASALSTAFSSRRDSLMWGRIGWLVVALMAGAWAVWATYDLANVLAAAFEKTSAGAPARSVWPVFFIRSMVLLPLFAAFGFAFSQYRKERDFEEEYAHKAAVATSLPNYGDLAREQDVKDQIVTGATAVIFTSPTHAAKEAEKSEVTIGALKEVIDLVGKSVSKK